MLLAILIITASIVLLLSVSVIGASSRTGVVPMPSLPSERRLVSAVIQSRPDLVHITDLGSGWGGMVRFLSHCLPQSRLTAVEKSLVPHIFSKLAAGIMRLRKISCRRGDLFELKLNDGEVYTAYLSGPAMRKLRESFERDQPAGGLLISIAFAMPGWTPARVEYTGGLLHTAVYVYEF